MVAQLTQAPGIPATVRTSNPAATYLETLEFKHGLLDRVTVEKAYENLDFSRATRAFVNAMPGASLAAIRRALAEAGVSGNAIGILETEPNSNLPLFANDAAGLYATAWIDLRQGPVVVEVTPGSLAVVADMWFHVVADLDFRGPERANNGKYLLLPPGHKGDPPEGVVALRSRTYGNWLISRGFPANGDPKAAVQNIKTHMRIYPLAETARRPEQKFVSLSHQAFSEIRPSGFAFFDEVNAVVQEEPADSLDPETLGLLASIGIEKGEPFAPDFRMRTILTKVAEAGNAADGWPRSLGMKEQEIVWSDSPIFTHAGTTPGETVVSTNPRHKLTDGTREQISSACCSPAPVHAPTASANFESPAYPRLPYGRS